MINLRRVAQKLVKLATKTTVQTEDILELNIMAEMRNLEDAAYIKGYKACLKKQEMALEADRAIYESKKPNTSKLEDNGLI